ncbi:MAG: FUSC family protein [Cyanobium sp.]
MPNDLVRQTLRLAIAIFITAAIAHRFGRIAYAWYPLLAVVVVIDDNIDQSFKAAGGRICGTILGGLITFLVHTILGGWIGVLVSLVLMVPVLRVLGWQSSLSTAALVSLMFLMIPRHEELNWDYVFQRSLDTALGCAIAIGVSLLLWPRNGASELLRLERSLRGTLLAQSHAHREWLQGRSGRPDPLPQEPLAAMLLAMERLLARELRGPHAQSLQRQRWPQRLRLWERVQHHWVGWESLLLNLPAVKAVSSPVEDGGQQDPLTTSVSTVETLLAGEPSPAANNAPQHWQALAEQQQLPLLMLLALAEEQRPLVASLATLRLVAPCP